MFLKNRVYPVFALLGALALYAGPSAHADVIVKNQSVTPNGSNFTWTYDVTLTNDETIQTGNYFTIYDFNGYVPGSSFQPAGWVFSSANVGVTPPKVLPYDNPSIPNLTWTYTAGASIGPGPDDLGLFGADSTSGRTKLGNFATEATKYAPGKPGDGKPVDNVGSVGVPTGRSNVIPEVDSLLLMLPGLLPLGLLLRRRS